MRMRAVMIANGKAAFSRRSRSRGTCGPLILMDIDRVTQAAVCLDRQNGNRPALVVGDQQTAAIWGQRELDRARAA